MRREGAKRLEGDKTDLEIWQGVRTQAGGNPCDEHVGLCVLF